MTKIVKYLSKEERSLIQALISRDLSYREMAKVIGRSHTCIRFEVQRNGGRQNYNAENAQLLSGNRNAEKKEKLSASRKLKIQLFIEKVESLEMQIEIIIDQLKELNERSLKNH